MPIIQEFIPYPKDTYANGFPNETGNGVGFEPKQPSPSTTDDTSYKETIVAICKHLDSLGLLKVNTDGALDVSSVDKIPTIDFVTARLKNEYIKWQTINYGFVDYVFDDEMQKKNPLTLRFTFSGINISNWSGNGVQNRPYFVFGFTLDIRNKDGKSIFSKLFTSGYACANGWYGNSRVAKSTNEKNSYSFYNKETSLYLRLLPSSMMSYFDYYGSTPPSYMKKSLMHFYIERKDNYIKIIDFEPYRQISGSSSLDRSRWNQAPTYIAYNGQTTSSNEGFYIPFLDSFELKTNPFMTFSTLDVDPQTFQTDYNYNVLSYYDNKFTQSGISVDITLDDNTVGKYMNVSISENFDYIKSQKIGILLRYE